MKFEFTDKNNKVYAIEAESYTAALDAFSKADWHGSVPQIASYRVFQSQNVASVLRLSYAA